MFPFSYYIKLCKMRFLVLNSKVVRSGRAVTMSKDVPGQSGTLRLRVA